jgi:hypothetical protein
MNASSRPIIVAIFGILIAIFGFLLTLDLWDLGTVVLENGVRFGAATHHYQFLGQVMLCAGAALSVFSAVLWAHGGVRPTKTAD